jgi:prepilin-type N-terminal cleavage/methylation domain-containing protein
MKNGLEFRSSESGSSALRKPANSIPLVGEDRKAFGVWRLAFGVFGSRRCRRSRRFLGTWRRLSGSQPAGRCRAGCGRRSRNAVLGKGGFVLWEMLLALSIFSIVALSLTTALEQAAETARFLRQESQVRHDLESILAESSTTKLAAGKSDVPLGDQRVRYEREVASVPAKNSKGQPLDHLWRVTVRAHWQERNQSRSSQAELVVYQP